MFKDLTKFLIKFDQTIEIFPQLLKLSEKLEYAQLNSPQIIRFMQQYI